MHIEQLGICDCSEGRRLTLDIEADDRLRGERNGVEGRNRCATPLLSDRARGSRVRGGDDGDWMWD